MTLANKISIARIALTPFFLICLLYEAFIPALVFFTASAITDAFDGLIARKRREQTKIGSFIDPLADRVFLIPTYILLTANHHLPNWFFVLLISRDFTILLGWLIYVAMGHSTLQTYVKTSGKIAISLQMTFFGLLLLRLSFPSIGWILNGPLEKGLYLVAILTFISFLDYLVAGSKNLGKILE